MTPDHAQKLQESKKKLRKNLTENILPFWHPATLDRENGGYHLNHDLDGRFLGATDRMIVTQARCLWFYAYLYNHGWNDPVYLDAARHGFDYLKNVMWDSAHGGFFWSVDPTGKPVRLNKHLYGQGFGLYALSEYALASRDAAVLQWANQLFELLENHAKDKACGGYLESFNRDWTLPLDDETNPMAVPHPFKLMNTHLHLMEPMTTYYQAVQTPLVRDRLIELIQIQSNTVVRKTLGACTDKYTREWQPIHKPEYDVVSYGHDIENIWLLMHASDIAGLSNGPLMDLYRTLFDYSYRYGFDTQQGGWYYTGAFNQPASNQTKVWWVQAEGLVASLEMFLRTEEQFYLDAYLQTLAWIDQQQTDWPHGDWFANVPENPSRREAKAHAWKGPYHNGRAMIRCLERIG